MKKIIALLLVLAMAFGLVACGGSEAPAATEAPKADAPAADAPAADAPAADAGDGARPFEGRTLTIAHGHHAYADAYNAQFAAFEEKYGCTIEVEMLSENADEQESLMLTRAATGTLPDVFPSNVGAKLQEFDPASNILDLAGQPFLDRVVEDFLPAVDGPNGEIYGVNMEDLEIFGYTVTEGQREQAGTTIVLHIKENTETENYDEFLDQYRLSNLVKKYSDFIKYPIVMEMTRSKKKEDSDEYEEYTELTTLNSRVPLWKKSKKELTDQEYTDFYHAQRYGFDQPVKTIHTSVEGNLTYTALMYIPATAPVSGGVEITLREVLETENTYRMSFSCSAGELTVDYFALAVKRADGSCYFDALLKK